LLEKTGHNAEAIAFLEPLAKSAPWEPAFRMRLAKAQLAAGGNAAGAQDSLAKLAAAPQIPYNQRVEAAAALSGSRPSADLGSAELKLLAGDPKNITPSSADHPFFYDARVIALQDSSDKRQQVQILSNALADTPAREDARVPLFYAAASLHSDEFALASIEQMLRDQRIRQVAPRGQGIDEEMLSSDEESEEQEASPTYSAQALRAAERAQLAQSVGLVLQRLQRPAEALDYFRAARRLEKDSGRQKEIAAEIKDVQALLRRLQLNAARQPILHADLEQDRLVRPRLVVRSSPPPNPAAKPGERP